MQSETQDFDFSAHLRGHALPTFATGAAWHYTTAEGLLGILRSNRIWASAPQVLNDESEVQYGVDVVREAMAALIDERLTPPRYERYLQRVIDDTWIAELQSRIFVASASRDGDLLSQWRNYATIDGFALGFTVGPKWGSQTVMSDVGNRDGKQTPTLFTPVLNGWYPVEYERSKQLALARDALLFATHRPPEVADDWPTNEAEWTKGIPHTRILLSVIPMIVKHPAFSDEREVRYIGGATNKQVLFRAGGGRIIPYTTVGALDTEATVDQPDSKFPLTDIICGPGCRPGTEDIVRRLLSAHGHNDVRIRKSTAPFIG